MLAFTKVKDDIININDIKRISIFRNSITVHFLSTNNPMTYEFDSEDEANFAIEQLWRGMQRQKIAY